MRPTLLLEAKSPRVRVPVARRPALKLRKKERINTGGGRKWTGMYVYWLTFEGVKFQEVRKVE